MVDLCNTRRYAALGYHRWNGSESASLDAETQPARIRAGNFGTEGGKAKGGNYSTMSTLRLSATSSIRLSGRISVIDIRSHSIGVFAYTKGRCKLANVGNIF